MATGIWKGIVHMTKKDFEIQSSQEQYALLLDSHSQNIISENAQ
jgi:hypothetical protein